MIPSDFLEAVEEADVIDSFSYASIEDWRRETPGRVIVRARAALRLSAFAEQTGDLEALLPLPARAWTWRTRAP